MLWRLIKWTANLVLALIVFATLAGAYLFYRAMPAYSGAERLPGLSSEARVWRDAHGVPHIFAGSVDDAARALGYLHASERMFQMDILRRVGEGRMAESAAPIFCPSTSSFAPWASIVRPRRAFLRFRPGRRSGLRRMPRASTPSSGATRSHLSSSSPEMILSPGSRLIRWSLGRSRPTSCRRTSNSSSSAPVSPPHSEGNGQIALSRREAQRSDHDFAGDQRHSRERR